MNVKVTQLTNWNLVLNLARSTVGKSDVATEPSEKFKREVLNSEHSPIRALIYRVDMIGIPYWVSVHLVRHKFGVEHFVSTQRTDRTGVCRDDLPQSNLVNHTMIINAQELMTISRRRLCGKASPETRRLWSMVIASLKKVDSTLAGFCVPMCVYRGNCFESDPCNSPNIDG